MIKLTREGNRVTLAQGGHSVSIDPTDIDVVSTPNGIYLNKSDVTNDHLGVFDKELQIEDIDWAGSGVAVPGTNSAALSTLVTSFFFKLAGSGGDQWNIADAPSTFDFNALPTDKPLKWYAASNTHTITNGPPTALTGVLYYFIEAQYRQDESIGEANVRVIKAVDGTVEQYSRIYRSVAGGWQSWVQVI